MTTSAQASDRRRAILQTIVEDYVRSCIPVASGRLVKRYELGVSSATVRKDMAHLEEEGLVFQPHRSAGRIPTEAGYRLFVEELLSSTELRPPERDTIRSSFRVSPLGLEDLLQFAASILSDFVGNVAFVVRPAGGPIRLKRVTIVPQENSSVRMIAELTGAPPQDRLIRGLTHSEPSSLQIYGRQISDELTGKNVAEIEKWPVPRARYKYEILFVLVSTMRELERRRFGYVQYVGLATMIQQPEFNKVSLVQRGVQMLEDGDLVEYLGPPATDADGVLVHIGDRNSEILRDYSVVLSSYDSHNHGGFLGVLGPNRMPYRRTIGAVRQVTKTVAGVAATARA
ncbi:MAG: heat-inducible transcriptional repressor HrcA [Chloroflexi bacterium]|nr:heat-inducible transcriptional repressor HrcA [Chloroflexota bacterium]MCY3937707.1 heat-inducible transcriptional repressor HrcA [Chloroflexota bacterium]